MERDQSVSPWSSRPAAMTLHYCQLLISRLLRIFWKITRVRRRSHILNAIRLLLRSASLHPRRSLHCKCAVRSNCTLLAEAATWPPPLWLRASLASLATWDSIVFADSRHFFCGRSCQVRFNTYLSLRLHFCKCIYGCGNRLVCTHGYCWCQHCMSAAIRSPSAVADIY